MATIKEIAAKAKLSPATVSRVLNYDQNLSVNESTKRRVFQIAEELHYEKGRRKKKGKSKRIAIVLWCDQEQEIKDLYYYSIRVGISEAAQMLGYESQVFYQGDQLDFTKVSGIAVIGYQQYPARRLDEIKKADKPLAFIDTDTLNLGYSCVVSDFHTSIKNVIDHFLKHDLTSIGMLAGDLADDYDPENLIDFRFHDYQNYLRQLNLYEPEKIYVGKFTPETGYQAMKKAINQGKLPQALVVANDAMAIGALKALRESKISVPEEMSLISFNDTTAAEFANPSLSSIHVNTNEMGKMGMKILHAEIADQFTEAFKVVLPTKLILRESSLN